eukprot:362318-Chlamydomonas_euryale.AAC.1
MRTRGGPARRTLVRSAPTYLHEDPRPHAVPAPSSASAPSLCVGWSCSPDDCPVSLRFTSHTGARLDSCVTTAVTY